MDAILTTDTSGQLWTATIFDSSNGSSLATFKSGYSSERSVCFTKERLFIGSKDRPIISVWDFRSTRKDGQPQRQTCPGIVSALDASPDGLYIAVGIEEKVYLWQLTNGMLVSVLTAHYQKVTRVRFTDDASHLVSASKDNMVLVWEMSEVVRQCTLGVSCRPLHVISSHTLPVTDLFIGAGGSMAHVISSSLDHSCKVWELSTGQQLCSLVFGAPVESVAADAAESSLFAGCSDGAIYLVYLFPADGNEERHISQSDDGTVFSGHSGSVTGLSVSMDGARLVSGSTDHTARIWDVASGQCLRVIQHKGAVGTVLFLLRPLPSPVGAAPPKALSALPAFQRQFPQAGAGEMTSLVASELAVKIARPAELSDQTYQEMVGLPRDLGEGIDQIYQSKSQRQGESESEVSRLRRINAQLYHLYAQSIIEDVDHSTSSSGNEY